MLRTMLAGSERLFCPPELNLLQYAALRRQSMRQRWALFYTLRVALGSRVRAAATLGRLLLRNAPTTAVYPILQQAVAPRILVEKSPEYSIQPMLFPRIEALFDEPLYIWLVRHPAAVKDSYARRESMRHLLQGLDAGVAWRRTNVKIRAFLRDVPQERQTFVRYEDLVTRPAAVMQEVAAFLGIPFRDALTDPYDGDVNRHCEPLAAQMNGDPWFADRGRIEPALADAWRERAASIVLTDKTARFARDLGYDLGGVTIVPASTVEAMDPA